MMIYSDQLILIDEFQNHFDRLWLRENKAGVSGRFAMETLQEIIRECKGHPVQRGIRMEIPETARPESAEKPEEAINY